MIREKQSKFSFQSKSDNSTKKVRIILPNSKINPNTEYKLMIDKSSKNRFYNPVSRSLVFRKELIAQAQMVAVACKLSAVTLYTGISYLDVVLSKWEIETHKAKSIVLVCLMLATKIHETCDRALQLRSLFKICKERVSEAGKGKTHFSIMNFETAIANSLSWDLDIQTPFHFLSFFLDKGAILENDINFIFQDQSSGAENITKLDTFLQKFRLYASRSSFVAASHYNFYKYTSLAIGAASIAVARLEFGFGNVWPVELEELTYVAWKDIEECFQELAVKMGLSQKLRPSSMKRRQMMVSNFRMRNVVPRSFKKVIFFGLILMMKFQKSSLLI